MHLGSSSAHISPVRATEEVSILNVQEAPIEHQMSD
jgi:hypothetical protein